MTKVLYVLGRGRSGSTVFANVLGAYGGMFSAGEVRYLWDPVVATGARCGCGEPMSTCEVWSEVLTRLSDVAVDEAAEVQREVVRERNLVRLLRYRRDGSWPALERFTAIMGRVYATLAEVTGASVIIDSSKRPSYAAAVRLMDGCDLYCIQMIRDPRASAYSWASRRHDSVFSGQEVKRRGPFDSTVRWDVLNLEAELLARYLPEERTIRVRYEDFTESPRGTAEKVMRFVGEADAESPFLDDRTVVLAGNHTVAGNPSRFATGEIELKDKGEWRTNQKPMHRRIATAVALPYLHRYGYPLR